MAASSASTTPSQGSSSGAKPDLRVTSRPELSGSFIAEEGMMKEQEAGVLGYPRLLVRENDIPTAETAAACGKISTALAMRKKYVDLRCPTAEQVAEQGTAASFVLENGVFRLKSAEGEAVDRIVTSEEFFRDYASLLRIVNDGPVKTLTYQRLKLLELKFGIHRNLNTTLENDSTKEDIRDFQNIMKVDTHVHLAAAMTASQLLSFIKEKLAVDAELIVNESKDHGSETLRQVFNRLKVDADHLTVDSLDVHGDNTFQRFDNFNNKYNPFGFPELRLIFLKSANAIDGRYFAELTRDLLVDSRPSAVATEYRVSVYGRSGKEWDELADWAIKYNLACPTNRWLIQVPRIYSVWNKHAGVVSFEAMLANIFQPLFEVSMDPSSHPALHEFLKDVSGFDSVDDESKSEVQGESWPTPDKWTVSDDPPYAYYMYYIWANLATLNTLRAAKGYSTFSSRPHCGESGDVNHLASGFLVADGINHGINLRQSMPLQYLYYLAQVPLAVSPLSNNSLFLDYAKNPFNVFFQRGLFVSLSTDDPLQFHYTQNPLIEEYSVASQHWNYNAIDLSELARNSVLMSGFTHETKCRWLGPNYQTKGVEGNNIAYTNVPDIRISFRDETLDSEHEFLSSAVLHVAPQVNLARRRQLTQTMSSLEESVGDKSLGWTALEITTRDHIPINFSKEGICAVHRVTRAKQLRKKYVLAPVPLHYEAGTPEAFATTAPSSSSPADVHPLELGISVVKGVYTIDLEELKRIRELPVLPESMPSNPKPLESVHAEALDSGARGDDSAIRTRALQFQQVLSVEEFERDYLEVCSITEDGPTRTFTRTRLQLLEQFYSFHKLVNKHLEKEQAKRARTDFYQAHKVDPHIHLTSSMHPEHFLVFVQEVLEQEGDVPIPLLNGSKVTLKSVFARLGIEPKNMTVDSLGMTNFSMGFGRFDAFREKGNPFGSPELREIFLSHENAVEGRYFGQLIKQVMDVSAVNPRYHSEYRISVSGQCADQWSKVAKWATTHELIRPEQNAWIAQVPRIYRRLRTGNHVKSFGDMLHNIFEPLFACTLNPQANPVLSAFLTNVSAIDCVGDESLVSTQMGLGLPPEAWTSEDEPSFAYYMYYLWANLTALNNVRRARGMNTFDFRPHAGTAGDGRHLCAAFLVSNGISHGLQLQKKTVLQYLFYLQQIPVYCSPISENALYMKLEDHPFISFFSRGLSVSLATDDPLHNHFTEEPLLEEYAIAGQVHALSPVDLAEIALNSVLHSGFSDEIKSSWLGPNFRTGNTPHLTNLPQIRHSYRKYTLAVEKELVQNCLKSFTPDGSHRNPAFQKAIHNWRLLNRSSTPIEQDDTNDTPAKKYWRSLLRASQIGSLSRSVHLSPLSRSSLDSSQ